MNIRALTLDLKKSEYLDDKKREAMIEQYDKIPTFWKERSKQIKWEFILTDEMPLKQNEGKKIALIAESSKKKTWINVTLSHKVFGTLLYKAFAQFVLTTYGILKNNKTFFEIKEKYNYEITEFYCKMDWKAGNNEQIFMEMFAFIIQTSGKNPIWNRKIDVLYDYVKSWVYGTIFLKKITFKQDCIKVGKETLFTEDQRELVEETFQLVPKKLKGTFINNSWKLRIVQQIDSYNWNVTGKCKLKGKEILIKETAVDMAETMLHEFGHLLDNIIPNYLLSCSGEFYNIYLKEKKLAKGLSRMQRDITNQSYYYATSNSVEFFATIFAIYLLDQEELKKKLPKSYAFFKKIIDILD